MNNEVYIWNISHYTLGISFIHNNLSANYISNCHKSFALILNLNCWVKNASKRKKITNLNKGNVKCVL